jgi:dimethylamine monooxygenase subunit A
MAMDLVTEPEFAWFEVDDKYHAEMAEKRRLVATVPFDVFAATPQSDEAREEALALIVASLTTHHPDWFSRDATTALHNHLTGESWNIGSSDPLQLAGQLVQEDLCLIQNDETGPVFTAASLCFPSRWRLREKIGKPLAAVHGPVPLYAERLASPVDRFMRNLKPNHIVSRMNWSLLDDPALFQPSGKWRVEVCADITPENAGGRIFLRVERQTVRRLPLTEALLFGVRVHVYPLDRVIDRPDRAAALANAVRALPAEIGDYKSLPPFKQALLKWLDAGADLSSEPSPRADGDAG